MQYKCNTSGDRQPVLKKN